MWMFLDIFDHLVYYLMEMFGILFSTFVVEPFQCFRSIYFTDLLLFFFPALVIDMPRYILSDIAVLIREWFFLPDYESTDFAKRLRGPNPPFLSVLMPGLNEGETVGKTIASFLESGYPNMEIIVVSDGSTDDMNEICRNYERQGKIRFFVHRERCGKSAAANFALKMARGEFVLHADADTTFDRDAIYRILLPFADPHVGAVSGNLRVRNWSHNLITRFQALEYLFSIGVGRRFSSMLNILAIISGAFGAFRRQVLVDVGGWDTGPGEDADVTIKFRKAGYKIAFAADAICQTNVPTTWKRYWKQRLRWNRSLIRYRWRKHRNIYTDWKQFDRGSLVGMADSFFFQGLMPLLRVPYFLVVASFWFKQSNIIIAGTFYFYTLSNIIQYIIILILSERPRQDLKLWWAVPLMTFFRLYETMDRIYACLDELFFETSFTDPYVPPRVQKKLDRVWHTD